jgi:hypothetical protein
MVDRSFFSHDLPGGGTVFDELSRSAYCFRLAGENIGWNTWHDPEATRGIHEMFLESPGHRQNVVGKTWDAIGVGAFKGPDGRKVWTVLFADACERDPGVVADAGAAPTAAPEPRASRAGTAAPAGADGVGSAVGVDRTGLAAVVDGLGWLVAVLADMVERLLAVGTGLAAAR